MAPGEVISLNLWMVNLCLLSYTFCLYPIFTCVDPDPYAKHGSVCEIRIRIHKCPEYGTNFDRDPPHCFTNIHHLARCMQGRCTIDCLAGVVVVAFASVLCVTTSIRSPSGLVMMLPSPTLTVASTPALWDIVDEPGGRGTAWTSEKNDPRGWANEVRVNGSIQTKVSSKIEVHGN